MADPNRVYIVIEDGDSSKADVRSVDTVKSSASKPRSISVRREIYVIMISHIRTPCLKKQSK